MMEEHCIIPTAWPLVMRLALGEALSLKEDKYIHNHMRNCKSCTDSYIRLSRRIEMGYIRPDKETPSQEIAKPNQDLNYKI